MKDWILPIITALAVLLTGCGETTPVRVTIISVNDHTVSSDFCSAVIELPNGRRMEIQGRFGRVGDSFICDVPASMAKEVVK